MIVTFLKGGAIVCRSKERRCCRSWRLIGVWLKFSWCAARVKLPCSAAATKAVRPSIDGSSPRFNTLSETTTGLAQLRFQAIYRSVFTFVLSYPNKSLHGAEAITMRPFAAPPKCHQALLHETLRDARSSVANIVRKPAVSPSFRTSCRNR